MVTVHLPIYLDYAATTPVDPRVFNVMQHYLMQDGVFGNPSSSFHRYGFEAEEAIEQAAAQVAALIHAHPKEIIWTSCATESNNLAIKGVVAAYREKANHIVTVQTEHKSVLEPCRYLEKQGIEVTYLKPQGNGLLDLDILKNTLKKNTLLVSVMHANNETGVIQDIAAIGAMTRERGIFFHVDATQSVGKIPIDLSRVSIDLMSFSAHKNYGPKGIGVLFVRKHPRVWPEPLIHGGGQQKGLRAGTLPTHQIMGMGMAFQISTQEMSEENKRILNLRTRLRQGIEKLGGVHLNGDLNTRVPGNLNVWFEGVEGEALIKSLTDIAISSGSACISAQAEPSFVLKAIGLSRDAIESSLRFTLGRFTTEAEIDYTIQYVSMEVKRLRQRVLY